ncbi:hypothetical protein I4F81_011847 [Pyropia yezoensis]|uniref:Uncharacterized protein n=1 Tax=Pyropia yezoensis TaxID=2788 RepID=A0ACC3CGN3_PYRYE|nr:hypothetical protein I4F81_011847 [Neopyropia yezoensis]
MSQQQFRRQNALAVDPATTGTAQVLPWPIAYNGVSGSCTSADLPARGTEGPARGPRQRDGGPSAAALPPVPACGVGVRSAAPRKWPAAGRNRRRTAAAAATSRRRLGIVDGSM